MNVQDIAKADAEFFAKAGGWNAAERSAFAKAWAVELESFFAAAAEVEGMTVDEVAGCYACGTRLSAKAPSWSGVARRVM